MLTTYQSPSNNISSDLQVIMDRVKEKTDIVFDKYPKAFDGVLEIMAQSENLSDYYEKFEAYLDGYLAK